MPDSRPDVASGERVPSGWLLEVGSWTLLRLGLAARRPRPLDSAAAESGVGNGTAAAMSDGILGSAHDFSGATWNSGGEICAPCHVPHVENTSTANTTWLWNHDVSTASYTPYSSTTLAATAEQPRGVSLLCLGCHDGTVALDAFGGRSGSAMIQGNANMTTDLSAVHPISIDWTHKGIRGACGTCHHSHNPGQLISPVPFFDGRVECATCHDPHNQMPDNPNGEHFLRLPISSSQICLLCHHK